MFSNPFGWVLGPQVAISVGSAGVDAVDRLGQLKTAEDASIDFYSFIRSSYYQMRRNELREALGLPPVVDSPALDDPDDESATATAAGPDATSPDATRSASASSANRPAAAPATSRPAPAARRSASPTASRSASASQ
jgi:hypothetical protein